jgi:hypothetical protein
MQDIIDNIVLNQQLYKLLPHYDVVHEKIIQTGGILKVEAEVRSKISRYKFMNKILSKIVDKELLHLFISFTFDPNLFQLRITVHPVSKLLFSFEGTFYCLENLDIINHEMNIDYEKSIEMVKKLFDKKIRGIIVEQTKRDIEILQQEFEKQKYKN